MDEDDQLPAEANPDLETADGFIGSMKGTMEIVGDILAPIDVTWEAESL